MQLLYNVASHSVWLCVLFVCVRVYMCIGMRMLVHLVIVSHVCACNCVYSLVNEKVSLPMATRGGR